MTATTTRGLTPAFPSTIRNLSGNPIQMPEGHIIAPGAIVAYPGMTLRQYLIGQVALVAGMLLDDEDTRASKLLDEEGRKAIAAKLADAAALIADAMIERSVAP